MKQALSIRPAQELKSTSLCRHRHAAKAYEMLPRLRGFAFSLIADKRRLADAPRESDPALFNIDSLARADLSGVTHTFPYFALHNSTRVSGDDRILIVIDNMKKREMDSIRSILSDPCYSDYDLIFRDSKDASYTLIQIADVIAGTVRRYYESTLPLRTHNFYCKACFSAAAHGRTIPMSASCRRYTNKKLYSPYLSDFRFNAVLALHEDEYISTILGDTFVILPCTLTSYYSYIGCMILGHFIPQKE